MRYHVLSVPYWDLIHVDVFNKKAKVTQILKMIKTNLLKILKMQLIISLINEIKTWLGCVDCVLFLKI